VKNRRTGRFELLLLGYLHLGGERVRLFDSPEAHGRLRRGRCLYVADDIVRFRSRDGGESCDPSRGDHPADSFWIMNFAVAVYNDRGLFAEDFPLADRLSQGEELYSFYGAEQKTR
jgi:hypothetical protein